MKKGLVIAISVCFCLVMIGLAVAFINLPRTNLYNSDKKLAADFNTYNLAHANENVDDHKITGKFETFEGMIKLWELEAEEDAEITMEYTLHVTKGNVKLVLISPDGTVSTLVEKTGESPDDGADSLKVPVKAGENRIKIVGDKNSGVEFELSMDEGKFVSY